MAGRRGELPERLLESGATDFERRLLDAAATRGPSREMSRRMASALGVSVTTAVAGTVASATATAPAAAGAKSAVSGGSTVAGWAWVAGGIVAISVVGVLVAGGRSKSSVSSEPGAVPAPAVSAETGPVIPVAVPSVGAPSGRMVREQAGGTLRDEIALLDGARVAVTAKSSRRALDLLNQYERTYPTGSLLPEAGALKIEALVQLGRIDEARLLAERFVIQHRGSLLSDRVAAVAGLARR